MDYLQTTGDRLHDLELDRILSRISSLEAKGNATSTPSPAVQAVVSSTVAGVRSLTPGSGTQIMNDIALSAIGSLTLSQAAQVITFTVPVLVAGSNITLTTVGNNITIAASGGGSSIPTNILVIASGTAWAVPSALTEFNASTLYRSQHDATNATSARLIADIPTFTPGVTPTMAAQFSTDGGSTWNYLDGSSGPSVTYAAGLVNSGWVTLTGAAKADVQFRIVASGGNGSTSRTFGTIYLQIK